MPYVKVKSKIVANCIESLNLLGASAKVEIKYVKAYVSHVGNEMAGMEAKNGTKNTSNKITIPPPFSWAKLLVKQAIRSEWCQQWYQ